MDIDPLTWNMSPQELQKVIEDVDGITAVMPVHIFGNPCDVDLLESITEEHKIALVFDSAWFYR